MLDLKQFIVNAKGEQVSSKRKYTELVPQKDGEVIEEVTYKVELLTLKNALLDAVLNPPYKPTPEETIYRYDLFNKLNVVEEIELEDSEKEELIKYINDRRDIFTAGQMIAMLK